MAEAKRLWIRAIQRSLKKDERDKCIKELMNCVKGHVQDIVFKHDASRIIQTLIKYGGKRERAEIANELNGRYKDLAQSKYSKVSYVGFSPMHTHLTTSEVHRH
jgi:pumilio family protein 6